MQNSVNSYKPASWSSDSEMSLILSWSLDNAHNYRETNQLINRKISHLSYSSLLLIFFFSSRGLAATAKLSAGCCCSLSAITF